MADQMVRLVWARCFGSAVQQPSQIVEIGKLALRSDQGDLIVGLKHSVGVGPDDYTVAPDRLHVEASA